MPPFPVTFLVAYLFKVHKSSSSYASSFMTHAALKWFHLFGLSKGANHGFNFIAQLVEHRTGIAEVTGSNPVEALIFFRLLLSNCLNWKIYCDDHSSLSQKMTFIAKVIMFTLRG